MEISEKIEEEFSGEIPAPFGKCMVAGPKKSLTIISNEFLENFLDIISGRIFLSNS